MQKDRIISAAVITVVLLVVWIFAKDTSEESYTLPKSDLGRPVAVVIGEASLLAEIADTVEERQQGLSNRVSLDENRGMLFIFDQLSAGGIWMKDMHFSIDIIWIDENQSIIDIKQNAQPDSFPEIFYPQKNAKYVLEVSAGFTKRHNIFVGNQVHF